MNIILYGSLLILAILFLLSVNRDLARTNARLSNRLKRKEKMLDDQMKMKIKNNQHSMFNSDKMMIENARLQNEVHNLRHKNFMLTQEIISYKDSYNQQYSYSDDIVEAVKKAMIYSHPDKGNCPTSDDFIKYKKIYDRLKGENNNEKQHY